MKNLIYHRFKMNLGNPDRVIRLLSGLGLVTFDYLASANWEVIFLAVGAWSVLTSVFGFCPFYRIAGYNSCPTNFQYVEDSDNLGAIVEIKPQSPA